MQCSYPLMLHLTDLARLRLEIRYPHIYSRFLRVPYFQFFCLILIRSPYPLLLLPSPRPLPTHRHPSGRRLLLPRLLPSKKHARMIELDFSFSKLTSQIMESKSARHFASTSNSSQTASSNQGINVPATSKKAVVIVD